MANGFTKVLTGVLLLTSAAFWVIMLAGTAAVEDNTLGSGLDFQWWTVFLQLFVVLLHIFLAFTPSLLSRFSGFVMAITAVSTVLLMFMSNTANGLISATVFAQKLQSGAQAAMAGSVVLSITNIVYMFMLGDGEGSLAPILRGDSVPTRSVPAAPVTASTANFRASKAGDVEMPAPTYVQPVAPHA